MLLDVARLHGVDHFDDGYPITGDDLDAAVARGGHHRRARRRRCWCAPGRWRSCAGDQQPLRPTRRPGLSTQSIEWLHDHDVAAVATDTLVFEVWPGEDPAVLLPVHMIHLRDMGLLQGQLWYLDELAADCAADGRYDFLLVATPAAAHPRRRRPGGADRGQVIAPVIVRWPPRGRRTHRGNAAPVAPE